MSRLRKNVKNGLLASLAVVLTLGVVACSVDSPTAPDQVASDPPTSGSNTWRISLNVSPNQLPSGSDVPGNVNV